MSFRRVVVTTTSLVTAALRCNTTRCASAASSAGPSGQSTIFGTLSLVSNMSTTTMQPMQFEGKSLEAAVLEKAAERDAALRRAYDAMPAGYPAHSQDAGQGNVDKEEAFRKRLIYRSKQRGWLEVDLLMGTFADKYIPSLSSTQLREYESILNRETLDLFNMATGRMEIPKELQGEVMEMIQKFVASAPLGRADPKAYEVIKQKAMAN